MNITTYLPKVGRRARAKAGTRVRCPNDGFAFAPRYTDGACPLCGWRPANADVSMPWLAGIDRFWLAAGVWAFVSIAMLVVVVLAYARG